MPSRILFTDNIPIAAFLVTARGPAGRNGINGQSLYDPSVHSLRDLSDSLESAAILDGFKIIVIDDSNSMWLFKTGTADPGDPDGQVDSLIDDSGFWMKVGGL